MREQTGGEAARLLHETGAGRERRGLAHTVLDMDMDIHNLHVLLCARPQVALVQGHIIRVHRANRGG